MNIKKYINLIDKHLPEEYDGVDVIQEEDFVSEPFLPRYSFSKLMLYAGFKTDYMLKLYKKSNTELDFKEKLFEFVFSYPDEYLYSLFMDNIVLKFFEYLIKYRPEYLKEFYNFIVHDEQLEISQLLSFAIYYHPEYFKNYMELFGDVINENIMRIVIYNIANYKPEMLEHVCVPYDFYYYNIKEILRKYHPNWYKYYLDKGYYHA